MDRWLGGCVDGKVSGYVWCGDVVGGGEMSEFVDVWVGNRIKRAVDNSRLWKRDGCRGGWMDARNRGYMKG